MPETTTPTDLDRADPVVPVPDLKARFLLIYLVVSLAASVVFVSLGWPIVARKALAPVWVDPIVSLVWYALLLGPLMRLLSRQGQSPWTLAGNRPGAAAMRWAVVTGIALVFVSLALFYATFVPLSYAAPACRRGSSRGKCVPSGPAGICIRSPTPCTCWCWS